MKNKHGTAKNAEQFAEYLLDEILQESTHKERVEHVIMRLRDLLANRVGVRKSVCELSGDTAGAKALSDLYEEIMKKAA